MTVITILQCKCDKEGITYFYKHETKNKIITEHLLLFVQVSRLCNLSSTCTCAQNISHRVTYYITVRKIPHDLRNYLQAIPINKRNDYRAITIMLLLFACFKLKSFCNFTHVLSKNVF